MRFRFATLPDDFTPRMVHKQTTIQATNNDTAPYVPGVPKSSIVSLRFNNNLLKSVKKKWKIEDSMEFHYSSQTDSLVEFFGCCYSGGTVDLYATVLARIAILCLRAIPRDTIDRINRILLARYKTLLRVPPMATIRPE